MNHFMVIVPIRRCSRNSVPLQSLLRVERYPHERRGASDGSTLHPHRQIVTHQAGPLACGGGLLTRRREARLSRLGIRACRGCPRSRLRLIEMAAGGVLSVRLARTAHTPGHKMEIGSDVSLRGFTNSLLRDKSTSTGSHR
jgi:hypothetical protein